MHLLFVAVTRFAWQCNLQVSPLVGENRSAWHWVVQGGPDNGSLFLIHRRWLQNTPKLIATWPSWPGKEGILTHNACNPVFFCYMCVHADICRALTFGRERAVNIAVNLRPDITTSLYVSTANSLLLNRSFLTTAGNVPARGQSEHCE